MVDFISESESSRRWAFPSESEKASQSRGVIGEALHSAAYAGLQAPLDGITQIIDRTAGSNLRKNTQFVEAPKAAAFGTAAWDAQQIGGAVGMVAPFFLLNKGVGAAFGKTAAAAEGMELASLGRSTLASGVSGALFEGVLRPSDDKESLLAGRFKNAVTGAATFGTLTAVSGGLRSLGLENRAVNGFVSGVPAGFISAETDSLLHGRGHASSEQLMQSAYGFSMVGGLMGVLPEGAPERAKESAQREAASSENQMREFNVVGGKEAIDAFRLGKQSTAWAQVRELLADGREGPSRTLFVQHNEKGILDPAAKTADILATCDAPADATNHVLPGSKGTVWLTTDANTSRVQFQTGDRPSELSIGLGRGIMPVTEFLRNNGTPELIEALPSKFRKLNIITTEYWNGNDSHVFGLEDMPDAVLKITTRDWQSDYGRRPFDAKILKMDGSVDRDARVYEGEVDMGGSRQYTYAYLQERVDTTPHSAVDGGELQRVLDENRYELTDPGSGAGVGRSAITGKVVVIDYPSATPKGSAENRALQEMTYGGDWADAQADREAQEGHTEDPYAEGYTDLDIDVKARQQAFLEKPELKASRDRAEALFGANPETGLKDILSQVFDGFSSKKEITQLQMLINESKGMGKADAKDLAVRQVTFAYELAKSMKLLGR